jgi:uncharacterized DUF497 family protein
VTYEWDPRKAASNARKHRVSFTEACTIFRDPLAVTYQDPDHSIGERRFITIGLSSGGHVLLVAHAENDARVRIISARRATRRESHAYTQGLL